MQLSRLLVSYPGHEGAIAPSARNGAAVRQTDHGCCDAGFSRAAHGSRDATRAVSGLKAIWPRRNCYAEQPENNETERGLRVVEHPRSRRALRPPTTPRGKRSTSRSHELPMGPCAL